MEHLESNPISTKTLEAANETLLKIESQAKFILATYKEVVKEVRIEMDFGKPLVTEGEYVKYFSGEVNKLSNGVLSFEGYIYPNTFRFHLPTKLLTLDVLDLRTELKNIVIEEITQLRKNEALRREVEKEQRRETYESLRAEFGHVE